jgi:hypothetical protein
MPKTLSVSRPVLALLCGVFVSLPFLLTHYPPITDLPQHVAQIRLLLDTIGSPSGSAYTIQWLTPYSLSYLILGGAWAVFGAPYAGRVAMLAIVLLWIAAIHWISLTRSRSAAAASLASVFCLNHIINWGFYSFAIGFPAFCLWFALTSDRPSEPFGARDGIASLAAGLLLYVSHVLWLAAGILWLGLSCLVVRRDLRSYLVAMVSLAPLFVAVWLWYPLFSHSTMATPPLWASGPLDRLTFSAISDSALGGIRGYCEPMALGVTLLWIAAGLFQNRSNLENSVDRSLLLAGAMFFALAVALPDKYMNTIRFGQRWMPPAFILLLLAVPAPAVRPLVRQAAALAVVAVFCVVVSMAWLNFERKDLSGLPQALEALPDRPRVLGLAFDRESDFIKGYPFIQIFAYSQVLKGGSLNFSFAEWPPCLVVHKKPFSRPWTGGLEWFPTRARESDLSYFDYALIQGNNQVHDACARNRRLTPVTKIGRWRLYRIEPPRASP